MHIECPHCQAGYDIDSAVEGTVLICHQCGFEFSHFDQSDGETCRSELPPTRKTVRIWPWLMAIMLLAAGSGFWLQKDSWLDNRWFRSTLINLGIDMPWRSKDWLIPDKSVQAEWITRNDGSKVLVIRAVLKNLLSSDMPLPGIRINFFSETEPGRQTGTSLFELGLLPSDKLMRQVPYQRPATDRVPVRGMGKRAFTILVESVPEGTGGFTLMPVFNASDRPG
ncbi:MAG: DUF3426 domain-containing protein [Mariprofundus sp.]